MKKKYVISTTGKGDLKLFEENDPSIKERTLKVKGDFIQVPIDVKQQVGIFTSFTGNKFAIFADNTALLFNQR